ncbi:hypothetical protein NE237_012548 [Protea cynaroides]|uniref:C2H2-type domain-containing protein n=1 Tax=Protea cynaroides TaxID=273540 RepID=A0A9Q0H0C4_9MAGN|nr:hypothetical protein NE237_012548 [Protea cynaroides]
MSNSTSLSEEASVSSGTRFQDLSGLNPMFTVANPQQQQKIKKKRNLPGNPDPDAEVIALSPTTLMATNRFVCEICNKGFQRDQNLQLHRRGHNLPWKLRQRNGKEIRKRVYVCPEPSCVHHHPSRALGDLTGIKKHFCRKHGEKKWKCEKCSKRYAVQSDWKAHSKTCGTREYRCDCGTLFSRKDSFITHRAFCDALAEESARLSTNPLTTTTNPLRDHPPLHLHPQNPTTSPLLFPPFSTSTQQRHQHQQQQQLTNHHPPAGISITSWDPHQNPAQIKYEIHHPNHHHHQIQSISATPFLQEPPPQASASHKPLMTTSPCQQQINMSPTHTTNTAHMSATALLQKAANVGAAAITGAAQAQSVGHMGTYTTDRLMKMDGFGTTVGSHMGSTGISPEYVGFTSGNLATWQKTDRLTRDFLGLAADGGSEGGEAGNGSMNVNVRDLLSYTGGVDQYPPYDRDHSVLKTPGFGFAEHPSESWGD